MTIQKLQTNIMQLINYINPNMEYCITKTRNNIDDLHIDINIQGRYFHKIYLNNDLEDEYNKFFDKLAERNLLGKNMKELKSLI